MKDQGSQVRERLLELTNWLQENGLLQGLLTNYNDTDVNFSTTLEAKASWSEMSDNLETAVKYVTTLEEEEWDFRKLLAVLSNSFNDLTQNHQELLELFRLKDRVEIRLRRCSGRKTATKRGLLQKIESHFETNFSQRDLMQTIVERIVEVLMVRLCQEKVGVFH